MSRRESLARIALAYAVALGVATAWLLAGPDTAWRWLDALVADVLATVVIFAASRWHRNSSFYDAYWSVLPPYLLGYWWWAGPRGLADPWAWLVFAVVAFWAIRLTANWVRTFPGMHHEDWRYPMLREQAGRWGPAVDFAAIHLIPTLQVFLGTVPAYLVLNRGEMAIGLLAILAALVGVAAVVLEWTADRQLRDFVATRSPGESMDRGLWAWSRHPNYFGEISFWASLGLFGMAASPADAWWVMAGTVVMVALFLGASIPMMEQRSLERRPSYQAVIDRVPRLFPQRPRRAA